MEKYQFRNDLLRAFDGTYVLVSVAEAEIEKARVEERNRIVGELETLRRTDFGIQLSPDLFRERLRGIDWAIRTITSTCKECGAPRSSWTR